MKISNGVTVLLEKELISFTEGFDSGIIGYISKDISGNDFSRCYSTKEFERKAYHRGYELGFNKDHVDVIKGNGTTPDWIYVLDYCIKNNLIKANGWEICRNLNGWFIDTVNTICAV